MTATQTIKLDTLQGLPEELLAAARTGRLRQQEKNFFARIRHDIDLYQGTPQADGSPAWVLHDPVTNRFIEIGWQEFEILNRWYMGSADAIIQSVNSETTLTIDEEDIRVIGMFLNSQNFLLDDPQAAVARQKRVFDAKKISLFKFFVSHYLFFRMPILRPDSFLGNTLWLVRPLFSRPFRLMVAALALLSIFLVMRQWDVFLSTSMQLLSWDSLLSYFAAIVVAKCIHEFGHAYCCKYYGLHVPVMGMAFMAFWPFLYTDTGETWKLTSRRKRLNIVASGMVAECMLAVFCTFLWTILPHGALRDSAFFLATTSWFMTFMVNVSPFMRWDGYYLLSDLTGIKNLQPRSIELAKWWLRELIFVFDDPPPEEMSSSRQYFMIAYAIGVWLYRLTVFLGIAVMVYHFTVKALGLVLGAIEIIYFIWLPIQKELVAWYSRREEMYWNKHSVISVAVLSLLLLFLFVPWRNYVLLPAVIRPTSFIEFYPPVPAEIKKIHVAENQQVAKGEPLFDLASTELAYRLEQASAQIELSEAMLQRSDSDKLRDQIEVAIEQNISARQLFQGLQEKREQLLLRAPFDGVMVRIPQDLRPGRWVEETENLGMLADIRSFVVYAYADAEEITGLKAGGEGLFYAGNSRQKPLPVVISQVGTVNAEQLADPLLASVNNGPIPVEPQRVGRYTPTKSVFLVQLSPQQQLEKDFSLAMIQKGYVRVASEPRSYALRIWRNFHSLLIRESGF